MVRFVLGLNSLTKFGVRLGKPAVVLVSLDLFDHGPALSHQVPLYVLFKKAGVRHGLDRLWLLVGADGEKF
jgi:hypothetical protein